MKYGKIPEVYLIAKQLPKEEKYGFTSRIKRCAIYRPANIAEGSAKYSQKDFIRFLQISLGSSYELETHILLCEDLDFIKIETSDQVTAKIQNLQKQIASLIKYNNSKQ